jgi:hypothetical protein
MARSNLDPELAYDRWLFEDEPFLNELCLAVLIGIRHQIERELLLLSARVAAAPMTRTDFEIRVRKERALLRGRKSGGWSRLESRLNLGSFPDWSGSLETLRLIVNSLKHDPWSTPEKDLLSRLQLSTAANYAPFAESDTIREALLAELGLSQSVGWCEIASEFVGRAERFVKSVGSQPLFAQVKRGPVSLNPDDFQR